MAAVQARLLRGAGHEVDQVRLPGIGASWPWPGKALAMPARLAAYVPTIVKLRRGRYDIVHIHWLANGVVGLFLGREFFAQAHGSDLHMNLNNPVYRRVTNSVLRKAKVVFYVTPNLKSYMAGYEGKLVYLPNPVDVTGIAAGSAPPTNVTRILIFTRLDPVKGVDRIFPATEELSRLVEITALSWGPLAQPYVRSHGRFVRFVPRVPHEEIGAFLQQFDLVIGQMRQGILSLMEIEALAAGRPVITAIDWDLYRDDPPPVVHAGSSEEVAGAVKSLRADPAGLARISREGREWAGRNHSYAHHLQILEASYGLGNE